MTPRLDLGDHLHEYSFNHDSGKPEPSVNFDYGEVEARLGEVGEIDAALDTDQSIGYADACAGWIMLLQFITSPDSLTTAGARAHLLQYWLDPSECRYQSLAELAKAAGCTKQNLSKALVDFRHYLKVHIGLGKLESTSATYAQSQHDSVAAGRHVSCQKRKTTR